MLNPGVDKPAGWEEVDLSRVGEMEDLRGLFLLDPDIIYLNHGSFGATPRPVFEAYQHWQRELERQPVEFLGRRAQELLFQARTALAVYLGASPDEIVYFPNPTTAMNMVARSLDLRPGDEILTTNHEYGAMDRTWRFISRKRGARYVQQKIALPIHQAEEVVEKLWEGVTDRTRAIFISHITSPTGLIFPIEQVCRRAREAGLLCLVDGAHAPGQIPLNLAALGADFYTGACHKWLCAPKGSAFLFARQEVQPILEPLVVSWGYESERPSQSQFIDHHEWQGTRDLAAFLSVPAAIEFQDQHDWLTVSQNCHELASRTRQRIHGLTGLQQICPDDPAWFGQMFSAPLPGNLDAEAFKTRLYENYRIEAPIFTWAEHILLRVSIQAYNRPADVDALLGAVTELLPDEIIH